MSMCPDSFNPPQVIDQQKIRTMRKWSIGILCALAVAAAPGAYAVQVVASIKPVHALVSGVMAGVGEPRLMIPGSASPHTYQMRPSEAQALNTADLIVWVGENLETSLDRAISNLGADAEVVTLHERPGMELLHGREGGLWSDEHDEHKEVHVDEHDDHGHSHDEFDLHLWLDPGNARQIVDAVADALIRIDPANAGTYRGNADTIQERIAGLERSLQEQLEPLSQRPFVVFHDGYQYFEHAFGLNSLGAVAVNPDRPPGAKRLVELRAVLAEHDVRCIFTEPQFQPDLVQTLIKGTEVRTGTLDPLGIDLEPGPDAWFDMMRSLGDSIAGCLGSN